MSVESFQSNCAQAAIIGKWLRLHYCNHRGRTSILTQAVLAYEYAITLHAEVGLVQGGKATSSSVCRLNRLIMVGLVAAYILDMFTWTTNLVRATPSFMKHG